MWGSIREGDMVDVAVEDGHLVLSRHEPMCVFCGARTDLRELSGRSACSACVSALSAEQ
jgi:hypothetical protein